MVGVITVKRVAAGLALAIGAGSALLGGLYHFYPAQAADFLRDRLGYDTVFELESAVFSVQDQVNQAKYSLLGQGGDPSGGAIEAVQPAVNMSHRSGNQAAPIEPESMPAFAIDPVPAKPAPMVLPEIQPLGVPLRAGEGGWRLDDLPRTSADDMLMAKASIRPDRSRPYAVVQALLFDQRRIDLHIVGGTKHPGGDRGVAGPGLIPQEDVPNLLAAWNGGFQGIHGLNSMYGSDARGVRRLYRPLLDGFASVAVFEDGAIKLGEWGRDFGFRDDLVAVRQNNVLLVDNCEVSRRTKEGNRTWGYVRAGDTATFITWRSAIGVTANGDFMVASGSDLSADALARALWSLGACYAMQLDINGPYVLTTVYYDQPDGSLIPKKVLNTMPSDIGRYLNRRPQERDFMYLTVR